jgi:iron complex outermembrane receptor protein
MSGREFFVCVCVVALPCLVRAGESVEEVEHAGETSVVGKAVGSGLEPGTSSAAVTVFDREDIETSGASTVPDLLRLVPGMDVVTATPFYQSVSSRLPWTDEGRRFLVLVDGREANLEFLGLVPWGILPLSLDDVERIEVVRGPLSSLHGAGALAGVIHITTRIRPGGSSGWVGLRGGELNSLGGGARASFAVGPARVSFFGEGAVMGSFGDPQVEGSRTMKLSAAADFPLSESSRLLPGGI